MLLFGDFTLKSGRKSPYFINTGEFKDGRQISRLGDFYLNLVYDSAGVSNKADITDKSEETEKAVKSKFNVLFGPSYKGVPLATVVSAKLADKGVNVNFSYDRKERKDHGDAKDILGYCPVDGDKIAIIEDVTTAGTSVRGVLSLLESSGINAEVTALYIAIDRMEKGTGSISATEQIKKDYGIEVYSIATTADIIEYLENTPEGCKPVPDSRMYAKKMREYLKQYGV